MKLLCQSLVVLLQISCYGRKINPLLSEASKTSHQVFVTSWMQVWHMQPCVRRDMGRQPESLLWLSHSFMAGLPANPPFSRAAFLSVWHWGLGKCLDSSQAIVKIRNHLKTF